MSNKELWTKTNRWNEIGSELFKLKDRLQTDYCLQPTTEEMFTKMINDFGTLRNTQLPLMLFQVSFFSCLNGPTAVESKI